jgi:hypothetical protein
MAKDLKTLTPKISIPPILLRQTLRSTWAPTSLNLTESLNSEAWAGAQLEQMKIPKGFVLAKNDDRFLYIAIDLVEDTTNDPGTGDYFWLTFDRNRNRAINPNVDVNYGLYPNNPNKMGRQWYLGPSTWTGLVNEDTESDCRIAFEASPNSATAHRIWKIRILLSELNVALLPSPFAAPFTNFGLKVHSTAGGFDVYSPTNFTNSFNLLHILYLARKSVIPAKSLGVFIGSVGLIPATHPTINSTTGRATTAAAYSPHVVNAAFGGLLNFMGNRTTIAALPAAAKRHKVLFRKVGEATWSPILSSWANYKWTGSAYELEMTTFDANGTYPIPNPAIDYSIDDLLVQFNSNSIENGVYEFTIEFYQTNGTTKVPTAAQVFKLLIDNAVPQVSINSIKHGANDVGACEIVTLNNATDKVVVNFSAHDPEGNLHSYGVGVSSGLGGGSLANDTYQTGYGLSWLGVQNQNRDYVPPGTCAYYFSVWAYARTTNGYGYIGYNSVGRSVTLIKPL